MTDAQALLALVAELAGVAAFAVAVLWQPPHRCRWQNCPHNGKRDRRLEHQPVEHNERDRP